MLKHVTFALMLGASLCALADDCSTSLSVKPFLYALTRDGQTSHILGTRHVGVALASLPKHVHRLIENADHVVVETRPPTRRDDHEFTARMARKMIIQRGDVQLSKMLSRDAWDLLCDRLSSFYRPCDLERFAPSTAYFELGLRARGDVTVNLDQEIIDHALRHGVEIGGLESKEVAVRLMGAVGPKKLEAELTSPHPVHLDHAQTSREEDLINNAELFRRLSPRLYRLAIRDRNRAWITELKRWHEKKGRTFFAVGTLHLLGPDGLLPLLETEGFSVERVH